ncbi:43945_t:CDS:10 [Gigaspora margarita]|uniref:43945_t:CDS:1 n=1 Tax=Gigaspora margarita TaxID=4874 RepID=A0ABN7UW30_GIGMA|nr:43945_t:CDS:10 [Gigaspora margarita]
MNFIIDCGLNVSGLIKFPPRDNLGTRAHPMAAETEAPSNSSDPIVIENEPKRTKLDPSIDTANGSTRRSRGQFYVETPVLSSVDWKSIDFILITNYKNMLALPYITEYSEFKGKVYATEPTVIFGWSLILLVDFRFSQMMKELVHFFGESSVPGSSRQRGHAKAEKPNIFYGFTAESNLAQSLYTIPDVQSCVDKIQPVRYGENLDLYGVNVTAHSAGYCLGSANWSIICDTEKIAMISSSSIITDIHPLPFNKSVLDDADVVILSDLCDSRNEDDVRLESILPVLRDIGNYAGEVLANKGNVLFPCVLNGIMFDVLDYLGRHLNSRGLGCVPFYAISPIAEESLKYSFISGEWMCEERQLRMYIPENPMVHKDMFERNLLYYAARADSSLQEIYQEPCVVFAGHSSLRSGAVINFIKKWGNNPNNAIIFIESEFNFKEAISAFDGLQIKTMHLPIDIRLTVEQVVEMIKELQPREVLFPRGAVKNADDIRRQIPSSLVTLYEHLDIVNISINSQYKRTYMAENLASEIYTTNIGETKVAALYANLKTYNNQTSLIPSVSSQILKQTYVIGNINVPGLIDRLTEQFYGCLITLDDDIKTGKCTIYVDSPKAVISLDGNNIRVETKDNYTRKLVSDVLNQLLIAF